MAAEAGIPVIACDRLLRGSPDVDYCATFENFRVGVHQAESLLTGLGPRGADDNNMAFFFNGAMSVLKPYIDDGKLVVRSGQTDYQAVTTLRWDGETARKRMEEIVTTSYRRAKVDGQRLRQRRRGRAGVPPEPVSVDKVLVESGYCTDDQLRQPDGKGADAAVPRPGWSRLLVFVVG
ncbi:substrate-binding domain-containing protein [Lentzea sp. CC55]|uniref:substrate-binding domain-containing protein n=1 Tax=Lentzea sp. CC55 TaxID=2884909 RepID=UPI001F2D481F|nr:substrate-binding domain-containing protein [Lentzea sp. CC55]MCG8927817.1 substrate-binding domain-containing protein [Lentzea sp. CC55]